MRVVAVNDDFNPKLRGEQNFHKVGKKHMADEQYCYVKNDFLNN